MWLDMRMHVCIFESLQLEGSYVRDLLVTAMEWEEDRGWGYMEGSDYIHGPWKLFEEKEEWGREGESINIEELMRSKGTSRWCLKRRISDPWSWPGLWNGRGRNDELHEDKLIGGKDSQELSGQVIGRVICTSIKSTKNNGRRRGTR